MLLLKLKNEQNFTNNRDGLFRLEVILIQILLSILKTVIKQTLLAISTSKIRQPYFTFTIKNKLIQKKKIIFIF